MIRSQKLLVFIIILLASFVLYFILTSDDDIAGYAGKLNKIVESKSIAGNMRAFASKPHRAGTAANHSVGERILEELRTNGANVWTSEYAVDLPQPGKGFLTMTYPEVKEIDYSEKVFQEDPFTTFAENEQPYFAYIPNSDVEGEIIYANFGDRHDYQQIKQNGISVAGKIAIVRTQGSCRGMKQMIAEEEGVAGLLLYPEIQDQGFRKPSYPEGPNINRWLTQRGSMLKFFLYPGDPFSPVPDHRASTIPTVPAIPITPEAAEDIMKKVDGVTIEEWKGWMNVPYSIGAGPARVRIQYQSSKERKKIRNIFATIGGTNRSDPVLMIASHYDAWIYGAADPSSGAAAVLEAAKALLALERGGWKPKRDIVFAFWDAEEYGMIGSTKWFWDNVDIARGKIGALIYVDAVRGPIFKANILPGLRELLDEVLGQFTDPGTGKTLSDFHVQYDMPGFSDDTIPFQNLAGVPVVQLNYGVSYTMYHSVYDNLQWMKKFGDPDYKYTANLTKIIGLYAIVLSRGERIPFRFSEFASHYERELSKIALEHSNISLSREKFRDAINLLKEIALSGRSIESADLSNLPGKDRQKLNQLLLGAFLAFTEPPGGTNIPFGLRNVISGPSVANECGAIDLPGVRRALQNENENQLLTEMNRFLQALKRSKHSIDQAIILIDEKM